MPARVSGAEPAFAEIEPFVAALPHIKLLAAIHKAWDSSPELRSALDAATRDDCWDAPAEQTEMLSYNWESDDRHKFKVLFKNTPADGKVHVGGTDWTVKMSEVREMLEEGDGEFAFEDEDGEVGGCEECGAPGSTCRVTLQVNRSGQKRLEVVTQVMCSCCSRYGEPYDAAGGSYTFSIAPHLDAQPKPKAKKKVK